MGSHAGHVASGVTTRVSNVALFFEVCFTFIVSERTAAGVDAVTEMQLLAAAFG